MEGTIASVPPQGGRKHPQQEFLQVDTTNILFICGGAFDGIQNIISERGTNRSVGFGAEVKEKLNTEEQQNLINKSIQELVSTCKNSCWGCFLPPCGGTLATVPSIIFNKACWTPSPDTSRVIDGFSDFLLILSTSSI